MKSAKHQKIGAEEALAKLQRYCAYQERCTFDVSRKLDQWAIGDDDQQKIIGVLRKDGFLSDERFAGLYVRSKLNQNKWGRSKIMAELQQRHIPGEIIDKAIKNIDEVQYRENLKMLISKKLNEIKTDDRQKADLKLKQYLFSKGYEPELIIENLKNKQHDIT